MIIEQKLRVKIRLVENFNIFQKNEILRYRFKIFLNPGMVAQTYYPSYLRNGD
jgi:hypothetical protein